MIRGFHGTLIAVTVLSLATIILAGCATAPKSLEPVGAAERDAPVADFLEEVEVVERPELEPDWADFVKDYYPRWRAHYWVDRGQWGNRGYLLGRPMAEPEMAVAMQITPLPPAPPAIIEGEPPKIETPTRPTEYVVRKGDTLWKIAGRVYRNPLKWPKIYRANKDKIKNPNKIYPNQVLTIPRD